MVMTPSRPMAGGTADGARPRRYNYWRTGFGEQIFSSLDFYVVQAGEYHCKPNYATGDFEDAGYTHFFYHIDGKATLEYPGKRMAVVSHNIFIVPPRHPYTYGGPHDIKYHWFALDGVWPQFIGDPQLYTYSIAGDSEIESLFVEIRETLLLRKPGYPLRAIGTFYELMARLEEVTGAPDSPESAYPEIVRNAIVYLRENYATPFSTTQTAAAVGVSPSHLRALFEKWVGESPKRFHTRYRISQAKRLLSKQSLSIAEAGFHVGYADVHHFSRVFKQVTGMAPSRYAERIHTPPTKKANEIEL